MGLIIYREVKVMTTIIQRPGREKWKCTFTIYKAVWYHMNIGCSILNIYNINSKAISKQSLRIKQVISNKPKGILNKIK